MALCRDLAKLKTLFMSVAVSRWKNNNKNVTTIQFPVMSEILTNFKYSFCFKTWQ